MRCLHFLLLYKSEAKIGLCHVTVETYRRRNPSEIAGAVTDILTANTVLRAFVFKVYLVALHGQEAYDVKVQNNYIHYLR